MGTTPKQLVTHFVDQSRKVNGHDPPRRVVGQVAKEIGVLAKEGIDLNVLRLAIDIVIRKGLDPSALASASFTAQSQLPPGMTYADAALLEEFRAAIQEEYGIGWPTGSRLVHGTHAVTYVQDPLGCDQPDYKVQWARPSRREVVEALKERKEEERARRHPSRP